VVTGHTATDIDMGVDSGRNITLQENSITRFFIDSTGATVTTGLHFQAQASDPTSSQEMQSNLNDVVLNTETFRLRQSGSTGPHFVLNRLDASPNDDDNIGEITWRGKDSAANDTDYAEISVTSADVTSTTEDAKFLLKVMHNGVEFEYVDIKNTGIDFDVPTADSHFFMVNGTIYMSIGASVITIQNTPLSLSNSDLHLVEKTAPSGVANTAKLFAVDSGGGKTILKVQFGTGAAQTIATEL